MANKDSNLNLVKLQQSQKEVVINALLNDASPAMFGGLNVQASIGLNFGLYGGYKDGNEVANAVITLNDNTTNYVYYNLTTKSFEKSTTSFGDFPCYIVTTSNSQITDWKDRRELGGGGGASGDPNFKGGNVPATVPVATGPDSIAIGNESKSTGDRSLAIMSSTSSQRGSVAIGTNNNANGNFTTVIGGSGNSSQSQNGGTFSGKDNNVATSSDYNSIMNSNACTIVSSAYNYNIILNSNQSAISSTYSSIINGLNSYIEVDAQYSTLIGQNGKINIPYTFQYSYSANIKSQNTGLSRKTTSTSETPLQLGDSLASVKNYKLQENQAAEIEMVLIGTTATGDVILFKDSVLVTRFSSVTKFVGEASETEKSIAKSKSSLSLDGTTARIIVSQNDIIIGVTPNISDEIQWACEFKATICQRS